jgi:hypothetical protein
MEWRGGDDQGKGEVRVKSRLRTRLRPSACSVQDT